MKVHSESERSSFVEMLEAWLLDPSGNSDEERVGVDVRDEDWDIRSGINQNIH